MRKPRLIIFALPLVLTLTSYSQAPKTLFYCVKDPEMPYNTFAEILVTKKGPVYITASDFSFALVTGGNAGGGNHGPRQDRITPLKELKVFFQVPLLRPLPKARMEIFSFRLLRIRLPTSPMTWMAPAIFHLFIFLLKAIPQKILPGSGLTSRVILYIGVKSEEFYIVPEAGLKKSLDHKNYKIGNTTDSNMLVIKGELPVKKIVVNQSRGVYSFAENKRSREVLWLGTGNGLFSYNTVTGEQKNVLPTGSTLTITHVEPMANGDVWFSTLEKGMGVFRQAYGDL